MTNPEEKPAAYASPPCFMHEVDPAWSGVAPDTEGNRMNDQASPTTLSKRELEQAGLQALLKIPDAAVLCDRKGVITFWNDGAARIFGYSATQAL
jgi:PAS domain-containing protein